MFLKELRDEGMRQDFVNPVLSISTMHYFYPRENSEEVRFLPEMFEVELEYSLYERWFQQCLEALNSAFVEFIFDRIGDRKKRWPFDSPNGGHLSPQKVPNGSKRGHIEKPATSISTSTHLSKDLPKSWDMFFQILCLKFQNPPLCGV